MGEAQIGFLHSEISRLGNLRYGRNAGLNSHRLTHSHQRYLPLVYGIVAMIDSIAG